MLYYSRSYRPFYMPSTYTHRTLHALHCYLPSSCNSNSSVGSFTRVVPSGVLAIYLLLQYTTTPRGVRCRTHAHAHTCRTPLPRYAPPTCATRTPWLHLLLLPLPLTPLPFTCLPRSAKTRVRVRAGGVEISGKNIKCRDLLPHPHHHTALRRAAHVLAVTHPYRYTTPTRSRLSTSPPAIRVVHQLTHYRRASCVKHRSRARRLCLTSSVLPPHHTAARMPLNYAWRAHHQRLCRYGKIRGDACTAVGLHCRFSSVLPACHADTAGLPAPPTALHGTAAAMTRLYRTRNYAGGRLRNFSPDDDGGRNGMWIWTVGWRWGWI